MKPELKTQADRWRYLLDGGTLKMVHSDIWAKIKDGSLEITRGDASKINLMAFNGDSVQTLRLAEWTAHVEPLVIQDLWDFTEDRDSVSMVFREVKVHKLVGKKFKVRLEEIV
jgi:hypothetical protein